MTPAELRAAFIVVGIAVIIVAIILSLINREVERETQERMLRYIKNVSREYVDRYVLSESEGIVRPPTLEEFLRERR